MEIRDITYPPSRYFSRKEASRYLNEKFGVNCAPQTLAKYACQGGGPNFFKFNRDAVYTDLDLDLWFRGKLKAGDCPQPGPEAASRNLILMLGGDPDAWHLLANNLQDGPFEGEVELE